MFDGENVTGMANPLPVTAIVWGELPASSTMVMAEE
jgi:hypothetical protein